MALEVGHPEDVYGKKLSIARDLGIGPTMAARVVADRLYTIGRGKLRVFDISEPGTPQVLGILAGLGNTRQIEVRNGVAYITSREDGVFIVDVADPVKPVLLCHYDPIEVATGMAVSGKVMFVACRSHGVELVDVSDPERPLHLSTVRTGEAQSLDVRNGFAYVGIWGTSELVVADVRNAREPTITARLKLDGYGDGVAVHGQHVYVATGHHSRARKSSSPKTDDPGYGRGHGLEIYDITDPGKPLLVSRIKTPPFYRIGNDMWGVKIAGDHAFVHDTHNGIFVISIRAPKQPRFVAHCQLPETTHPHPRYMGKGALPGYVGGLALAQDHIYVAGGWSDLHVVPFPGVAKPVQPESDTPPQIPSFTPRRSERFRIWTCPGQVRGVAFMGDLAIVAAGADGVHLLKVWPEFETLARNDTQGFAMEVSVCGDTAYVAEAAGGLSIWQRDGDALKPVGRYKPRGRIVRDVKVYKPGRYAVLLEDMSIMNIVDVSDPAHPKSAYVDKGHGFLYHLGEDLIDGREFVVLWQLHGLRWYDLYGGPKPTFGGDEYRHRLGGGGSVPVGDDRLVAWWSGILRVKRGETRLPKEVGLRRLAGTRLHGRTQLIDGKLTLAARTFGDITTIDIADPENPKLVEQWNTPGNPGRLVLKRGRLVIPNGYEGLWVER
ncbi:MAG: hypothetical protein HN742_16640 [Lentisphaerae bacterium]|nr:hypothetical protein [Lentisphaerota bacterium]MBT4818582.1 hypothetical protein [Lentisphaerota bacterium]MBT5609365.1 hypothetical protein [Lentisphaerota bacterium]MBT7057247.1 hypothetical protein [Lentisphaerota bacterium]MBT7843508.1 hypothetical protein [Lentisphaerota bacterium]